MEICKVEFTNETGQRIILDFSLQDDGSLEYKPSFHPKVDPKTNLGLAGQLCEIFMTALYKEVKVEEDDRRKRKLES